MSSGRRKRGGATAPPQATVVIVNSDAMERTRLAEIAKAAGYQVFAISSAQEVLRQLAPPPRTVLVLDSCFDPLSPATVIDALHDRGVYLPTLVTVPSYGIHDAVDAIRRNATDVLEQPVPSKRFLYSIDAALEKAWRSLPEKK